MQDRCFGENNTFDYLDSLETDLIGAVLGSRKNKRAHQKKFVAFKPQEDSDSESQQSSPVNAKLKKHRLGISNTIKSDHWEPYRKRCKSLSKAFKYICTVKAQKGARLALKHLPSSRQQADQELNTPKKLKYNIRLSLVGEKKAKEIDQQREMQKLDVEHQFNKRRSISCSCNACGTIGNKILAAPAFSVKEMQEQRQITNGLLRKTQLQSGFLKRLSSKEYKNNSPALKPIIVKKSQFNNGQLDTSECSSSKTPQLSSEKVQTDGEVEERPDYFFACRPSLKLLALQFVDQERRAHSKNSQSVEEVNNIENANQNSHFGTPLAAILIRQIGANKFYEKKLKPIGGHGQFVQKQNIGTSCSIDLQSPNMSRICKDSSYSVSIRTVKDKQSPAKTEKRQYRVLAALSTTDVSPANNGAPDAQKYRPKVKSTYLQTYSLKNVSPEKSLRLNSMAQSQSILSNGRVQSNSKSRTTKSLDVDDNFDEIMRKRELVTMSVKKISNNSIGQKLSAITSLASIESLPQIRDSSQQKDNGNETSKKKKKLQTLKSKSTQNLKFESLSNRISLTRKLFKSTK